MTHLVILTVQVSPGESTSVVASMTPAPGTTRIDVLEWAREQLPPKSRTAPILFFSVEPNTLGGGR